MERVAMPGDAACMTLVRVDLGRYRLRVLAASHASDGAGARTAAAWAHDFGETGAINTSMYLPNGHSIGLLRSAELVDQARDNPALGALLLFDPRDARDAPAVLVGRDCPGVDVAALGRRYRGLVQNYRLLDCDGRPLRWKDARPVSAAAIALDGEGRLVLVHRAAAAPVADLATRLADPALGLRAAMYVEGGREASLFVRGDDEEVRAAGRVGASGWLVGDGATFWPIPNVLSFAPRAGTP